jgi:L-alanine-DL-glutamate epimerase-like enolase superfamily enzyme
MNRTVQTSVERFPIAGSFTISRGAKTEADVVCCILTDGRVTGRGECVPYKRYGESIESVVAQIEAMKTALESGLSTDQLQHVMPYGAARNAVDCALHDLEAKTTGRRVAETLGISAPKPLETAYTISLGDPDTMAANAQQWAHRSLLKIKVGTGDDESRIRAVRAAAPRSKIILDANEGWTDDNLERHLRICAELGISLIEQPLPQGHDGLLARIQRPVPVCADESVHATSDLAGLKDRYDAINIKLDKAGGLTEALRMKAEARRLGFQIMVGCMVGTSLAMAPAVLLAQDADYVDLDGPLLLARDREPALTYSASMVFPPDPSLWG